MPATYFACCPRSLTRPAGITILEPQQRVSRVELDKRDRQWRALRESAYARSWAEDATLVGSMRSYGESGSLHRRGRGGIRGVGTRTRPTRLTATAWKRLLEALRND